MGDRPAEVSERITLGEADIDALGHLNQARYHGLLGATRGTLLRLASVDDDHPDGVYVVVRVELEHHHEVLLTDGYVDVRARIARVGTRSVTIENELLLPDGTLSARGTAVMVAWDRRARGSRLVTDAERAIYEGAGVVCVSEG